MFSLQISFISGCVLGVELLTPEDLDEPLAKWGFCLDLLIIRFVGVVFRDDVTF